KTETVRPGGYDAEYEAEVGMEKLEAGCTLIKYDADMLALFGVTDGNSTQLTFRGALKSELDGTEKAVAISMRGKIKEVDKGTWKPGEIAKMKISFALNYYKEVIDGRTVHEIDVVNMIRLVNGVDQLQKTRQSLGI